VVGDAGVDLTFLLSSVWDELWIGSDVPTTGLFSFFGALLDLGEIGSCEEEDGLAPDVFPDFDFRGLGARVLA
jgi:hypothetical protein